MFGRSIILALLAGAAALGLMANPAQRTLVLQRRRQVANAHAMTAKNSIRGASPNAIIADAVSAIPASETASKRLKTRLKKAKAFGFVNHPQPARFVSSFIDSDH